MTNVKHGIIVGVADELLYFVNVKYFLRDVYTCCGADLLNKEIENESF